MPTKNSHASTIKAENLDAKDHVLHEKHMDHMRKIHPSKKGTTHELSDPIPEIAEPEHPWLKAKTSLGHSLDHQHDQNCGHKIIPHHDHFDYLVDGHLHHMTNVGCEDHGHFQET